LGSESCATTWQDLQGVQGGEEVVVTDRGRAIARVLPMNGERTIDRLIREGQGHPGSEAAADAWNEASRIAGNRLLFAEARAALAQARRTGLDDRYAQLGLVEIDDVLVRQAGELADSHGLRGYDAVHLAAARRILDADLVLVAGDRTLLAAAESLGLAVAAID